MSTQAHSGHLILPIDPIDRLGGEMLERKQLERVYKKAHEKPDRLKGRVLDIDNVPFESEGVTQHWSPIQVAVMAVRAGMATGFDVIHVHTPPKEENMPGDRAEEHIDFAVSALIEFILREPDAFPLTKRGAHISVAEEKRTDRTVILEDEAGNTMPTRWGFTPGGIWAPHANGG